MSDFMARRIREERKRLRLTQGDLAEKLGVTQGTISKWETGTQTPDFESIIKLSALAGFDAVKFSLTDEEEHPYDDYVTGPDIKVVGAIAENVFVEKIEWEPSDHFSVSIPSQNWGKMGDIRGFIVRDDSALPVVTANSIVFAVEVDFRKFQLRHKDLVVVSREDKRGLLEVRLFQVFSMGTDELWISPISEKHSSDFFFSLEIDDQGSASGVHLVLRPLRIIGVVFSSYRLESAAERVLALP